MANAKRTPVDVCILVIGTWDNSVDIRVTVPEITAHTPAKKFMENIQSKTLSATSLEIFSARNSRIRFRFSCILIVLFKQPVIVCYSLVNRKTTKDAL